MSDQLKSICGICERPTTKFTRVEAGVRYCPTCYARSFKRLKCGGCGMFKRLLASKEDAQCQACFSAKPCVRCGCVGRPLGKVTPQGPVCNVCYRHFADLRPCEICGQESRVLSSLTTGEGEKKACPRCQRSSHRTCVSCRKHRPCEPTQDGKWQCRLCKEVGETHCTTCSSPMAAGNGKRCEECYWAQRCERSASQLLELLRTSRVRDAFTEFCKWLPTQGSAKRAAMKLTKHVELFEMLDGMGDEPWTGEILLKQFGPATLRRYELPVRWMQSQAGVVVDTQDKVREADARRVRHAMEGVPTGSVARALLEAYEQELSRRCAAGRLTERSKRLAFRPALALLLMEDPLGRRAPTQAALERYMAETPGQRASVSPFLKFLESSQGIELRLPTKPSGNSAVVLKSLEARIASLMAPPIDVDRIAKHWAPLALRYFHRLSAAEAKSVCLESTTRSSGGGKVLTYRGQDFWIPAHPMAHPTSGRLAYLGQNVPAAEKSKTDRQGGNGPASNSAFPWKPL